MESAQSTQPLHALVSNCVLIFPAQFKLQQPRAGGPAAGYSQRHQVSFKAAPPQEKMQNNIKLHAAASLNTRKTYQEIHGQVAGYRLISSGYQPKKRT